MLGYEFDDFDTNEHVVDNPHIRGLTGENIVHILTTRCITSYYPVRTLSYALDYQLWGLNAGGYRVTNGLVHLTNVLLVYWLILRLYRHPQFPRPSAADWRGLSGGDSLGGTVCRSSGGRRTGCLGAGAGRAAHDVGALGCLHFHMAARRLYGVPRTGGTQVMLHSSAAVCCAAGCLSNAVGVVIPLLATAWDVLLSSGFSARCAHEFQWNDFAYRGDGKHSPRAEISRRAAEPRRVVSRLRIRGRLRGLANSSARWPGCSPARLRCG